MITAIVVEGGAMRGIYSAGVLDVFLERGFDPFDLAIGASAGACNLSSHLAGQHERNLRCYTTQMRRDEFMSARRFFRGGHWLDVTYLWDAFAREDPLDARAATSHRTKLVVAATSVSTGQATYFEPTGDDLIEVLRASSAVPVLYREQVAIGDDRFTDGGMSAPIPVEEAYRRGARKIMVVRSRPRMFGGPSKIECAFAALILRDYPALARAFLAYRSIYQRSVEFLRNPPSDCTIVEIVPEVHLRTGRTTRDRRALLADYALGRAAGERAITAWRAAGSRTPRPADR